MFHQKLFLSLAFCSTATAEFLDNFLKENRADEQKERELFLFDTEGLLGQRCGNNNPCVEGLECIRAVGRKACYPKDCAERAYMIELVEKQGLDTYHNRILAKAGLREEEDIWNKTTMALGENALNFDGLKYILNQHARTSIIQAIKDTPLDMGPYVQALENCTDGRAPSVQGAAGIGGLMFKAAAGFKFQNTFYYIQGSNNTGSGSIFTDICLGAGPDIGAFGGALGGVAFTGEKDDLLACSIQYDFGAAAGVGLGFANGYTIPGCVGQLEFYGTIGIGGGGGLSGCFTSSLANYD